MKSWIREKIIFPLFLKLMGSEVEDYLHFTIVIGDVDNIEGILERFSKKKNKPTLTLIKDD